ncbi:MAG: fatty acid cis/trans isomerase [Gemmatimonadota bacterium]|nr:fatty acid cis/trans isomerase [Gemmatimonadota bacterium]
MTPGLHLALRYAAVLVLLLSLTMCGRAPLAELPPLPTEPSRDTVPAAVSPRAVQEVLNARCVVCHACYDAPCQLVLTDPEGLARGASKQAVYRSERLSAAPTTRLFTDAKSTVGWRSLGFFSVTEPGDDGTTTLMQSMLQLGIAHLFPAGEKLPTAVGLDIGRELSCPAPDEFADYAREHPLGGMPYGTAPLSRTELETLGTWLAAGAPHEDSPPAVPRSVASQVTHWESFLNGPSLKERVVARYLYEHWFQAHLFFDDLVAGPFFQIVRSRTPPDQPVDEIATRRPYDAPGVDTFWYRLRPVTGTIVHKTHTLYALSRERQARLASLFLADDWEPTRFPSYQPEQASNPFVTYAEVPARARYQYMLDDAQYFVMSFIRGPVCRGQIATNVIQDHFFVAFLDPDHDISITDPRFLASSKEDLSLPAEHLSRLSPSELVLQYRGAQRSYLERRNDAYQSAAPAGPALDWIWDGDDKNTNALLTVFRHEDNATVIRGWQGGWPKTAWVIDYPLFERIYYDLVAGFDVFGSAAHEAATRLYMDHLRMQSENNFLSFLPPQHRESIHASWYIGATRSLDYRWADELRDAEGPTRVSFQASGDVKVQLFEQILEENSAVAGPPDPLNRCKHGDCDRPETTTLERQTEAALRKLSAVRGPWVQTLPEVTRLRVRSADQAAAWTLVRNIDHDNVAYMFGEQKRIAPENDTLTIRRGYLGSYPNFAFDVPLDELDQFSASLQGITGPEAFSTTASRWGVRRTSERFWPVMDWFADDFRDRSPREAGLFDLGRYQNR